MAQKKSALAQKLSVIHEFLSGIEGSSAKLASGEVALGKYKKKLASRTRQLAAAGGAFFFGVILTAAMMLLNVFWLASEYTWWQVLFHFVGLIPIIVSSAAILGIVIAGLTLLFVIPIRAVQRRRVKRKIVQCSDTVDLQNSIAKAYQAMPEVVADVEMFFPGAYHPQAKHIQQVINALHAGRIKEMKDVLQHYEEVVRKDDTDAKDTYLSRAALREIVSARSSA